MKPSSAAILWLLETHPEGVTPLMALEEAGCFRLGARIWDLRHDGYAINAEMVRTPSGKTVARYTLATNEQLRLGVA